MKKILLSVVWLSCFFCHLCLALPAGFVYLADVNAGILQDMRYFSGNNFVGRPIHGYDAPRCILTGAAAQALGGVQQRLQQQGLGLLVYDCYRPQTAVNDFIAWSGDRADQKMKTLYYPHVNKADVFRRGYVSMHSGHTRGSTVDVTLVSLASGTPVNMGTHFDYLDPASHPLSTSVTKAARQHRLLLRQAMQQAGFKPTSTEWWHFTLVNEPFQRTYFDFPVA